MLAKILFTFSLCVVGGFLSKTYAANPIVQTRTDVSEECKRQKPTTPAEAPCDARSLNFIEKNDTGLTLYIEGQTDRQLYDILVYDPKINRIEFNSYGGRELLSEAFTALIRKRNITTSVREGAVCGSLCVLAYQAGAQREAHATAMFGLHGQQIGRLQQEYEAKCLEVAPKVKKQNAKFCEEFKKSWADQCRARTEIYHAALEEFGASTQLYPDFKARELDPEWDENGNCATVMPWVLKAQEASQYGIVQEVKP